MKPRAASTIGALDEHYVYRLYDGQGQLLYIGVTYSVPVRMQHHRSGTPWFPEVTRVESQAFPTRRAAFAAEALAIHAERPLHNVRHMPAHVEPGQLVASP